MGRVQKNLLIKIVAKCKNGKLIISEKDLQSQTTLFNDGNDLLSALQKLEREDFIQVIYTDRHGEPYLYITLLGRANLYFQQKHARKKEILLKLALAVLSAVITFVFGRILYAIFS